MALTSEQFDKCMKGDVTGWTAYLALEKVLERWYKISKEPYAEWLYTSLRSDPALQVDWAICLTEAIKERGEGNRTELVEEILEEYKEIHAKAMQKVVDDYNRIMKEKEKSSSVG